MSSYSFVRTHTHNTPVHWTPECRHSASQASGPVSTATSAHVSTRQHTPAHINMRQHASKLQLKLLSLYEVGRTEGERGREEGVGRAVQGAQERHTSIHINRDILLFCRSDYVVLCLFTFFQRRVQRGWEGVGLDMWQQELGWWGLCTVFGKVLPSPGRMV
jgi:hypothetical protein